MAICPQCREKMGLKDVRCPRCGYDFPGADGSRPAPPTVVGTLVRWVLALTIFAGGFYLLSFATMRFGEPVTAPWLALEVAGILALGVLSYLLARRVTERVGRGRGGRPPAP